MTFGYNDTGSSVFKEITDKDMGEVTRHAYMLHGTQIVKETVFVDGVESYTLIYLYDESEAPVGMRYRSYVPSMTICSKRFFRAISLRSITRANQNLSLQLR